MPPKSTDKKAPNKKGANGYKLPDPIPAGEVLTDIAKKQWIIGPSIGVGGFGEIYSASVHKPGTKTSYNYVVKIEPHGNGPLFVEMHFYMRNAKSSDIDAWIKKKNLPYLGMPRYIGSGSHECKGQKYRFVVMERFGKDLWSLFLESERVFPVATVFRIAHQVLNVLEYIHSRGYVHADIKGANILMDIDAKLQYQTYLVDFGLASHFTTKDFKPDPKKAHNGTIEYTSRDAHHGVLTRRGDIEILAYNLLQWLGNKLPWEENLKDPVNVQKRKEEFMSSINNLKSTFKNLPVELIKLFEYVIAMKYDTEPDYEKLSDIFQKGYSKNAESMDGDFLFMTPPVPKTKGAKKPTPSQKAEKYETSTPKEDTTPPKRKIRTPKSATKKPTSATKKEPSKELTPNKITFDLADLSGSDDNYEPPESLKRQANAKQSRNHLKRVQTDEKTPTKKIEKSRRIKSDDDIDEPNEDLKKVTRTRLKRTQSVDQPKKLDLSDFDDNCEPLESVKRQTNAKQSRNHLKRVQSDDKTPTKIIEKSRRVKSDDDIDEPDEGLQKVTRTRLKRAQSVDQPEKLEPSPRLRKRFEPKKETNKVKQLLKSKMNSSDAENKDSTIEVEKSDSDIFLSFTEETNASLEDSPLTANRRRSSSRFHPKNISSSPVKTSLSDDSPKKTSKRKVLTTTVDKNEIVKKTRSGLKKGAVDWKSFPTIQNGKTVSK